MQDEIAVTAPTQINLKLHGQEITRCWKPFTFHTCVALMLVFEVRAPSLNKGREGTRRERCYLPFHTQTIRVQGDKGLHFPPPWPLISNLFQRKKVLQKKRCGSEKPEIADSTLMPKDSWRSGNCTETFHFPNNLATKLPLLGEGSSDRFLNGCFVIQPVQPHRGALSEEV